MTFKHHLCGALRAQDGVLGRRAMCIGEKVVRVKVSTGETCEWVVKAYIKNHVTVALNKVSTPCSFEANWDPQKKLIYPKSQNEPQWEAARKLLGERFNEALHAFSQAVESILERSV